MFRGIRWALPLSVLKDFTMNSPPPRDPRFPMNDPSQVPVVVTRLPTEGATLEQSGELVDMSRSGLRIRVEQNIPMQDELQLTIRPSDLACEIQTSARVSWAEPDVHGGWSVGCALKDRLQQDSIDELATTGALERRTDDRLSTSFVAAAKTELEPSFHTIQIVDVSDGGFCVIADRLNAKVDDRLLVKLNDETAGTHLVRARVAWVNTLEGGQTLGCVFLTKADHGHMQMIAYRGAAAEPTPTKHVASLTRWSLVAGVVAIMIFVHFFLLFQA